MRSFIVSATSLPWLVLLASLHATGCGLGACERIDEPCRSHAVAPITTLFGAERIDACTDTAATLPAYGECPSS